MNFAVYSKDGCPYCDKIKQVLDLTKTSYVVYNLGEQFDRESFYDEFGEGCNFSSSIWLMVRKLGGCIDTIKYLKENQIIRRYDINNQNEVTK